MLTPFAMDITNAYYSGPLFLANGCELFGTDDSDAKTVTFNNESGLEVAKLLGSFGEEKHMVSFSGFKVYCVKSNTQYPTAK